MPCGGLPEGSSFVWPAGLVVVRVPAPRPWTVLGIATVAGTAAALVTWGAAVEGRLLLAERDALGLGAAADPPAASLLERLRAPPPPPPPPPAGGAVARGGGVPPPARLYPGQPCP